MVEARGPHRRPDGHVLVRTVGELLFTFGLIVLLFVVYELWVTDLQTAEDQDQATGQLHHDWAHGRSDSAPGQGKPFTRLYIPKFGSDYAFTVIQGVGQPQLARGPGHYPSSAMPGHRGNFALAGHRIGRGAPFINMPDLDACDPIIIETRESWYLYRVLPLPQQVHGWSVQQHDDPRCRAVPSFERGPYKGVYGRSIIDPHQVDVVNPVPGHSPHYLPMRRQQRLLTLTTCNPLFGNSQRMIVHAVLTRNVPKTTTHTYGRLRHKLKAGEI